MNSRTSRTATNVAEFRRTFGLPTGTVPALPSDDDLALHARLLTEELTETVTAIGDRDPVEILDGLADIVYVAYGAALHCGFDLDAALEEVHRSNMSKLDADGSVIRREDGKVLKGPYWSPPDLRKLAGQ